MHMTSSVNQDGVLALVVNCSSLYSCQTVFLFQWFTFLYSSITANTFKMNYELVKSLIVIRVNMFNK